MKKNLLPILLLLVLGGAAAYFYLTKSGSTLQPELTNYALKDTASITKIFLADKQGNKILLERESSKKCSNAFSKLRKNSFALFVSFTS